MVPYGLNNRPDVPVNTDSDGSGTSDVCVSNTIGAERLAAATQWLQENNLKGFLGEMGAGSNCMFSTLDVHHRNTHLLCVQRSVLRLFMGRFARCNRLMCGLVCFGGLQARGG